MCGVSIVAGSTTWELTPSTLKSYPQTWHPGAFSKSSASKEDSPPIPEVRAEKMSRKIMKVGFTIAIRVSLTERVDDAFLLLLNALEATDPLSTIAHGTNSGGPVWALKSWNEEVPCSWETPDTDVGGGIRRK
jgi:hypothetical protein